jgi:long-subunit fatty acid transport protein
VGFSFSNYTNRDFTLATTGTLDLRGAPVNVSDTFSSRGGLNDFRIAGSYRFGTQWAVGGGFHIISGSNRLNSTRVFDDPNLLSSRQRSELSFAGVGISIGVTRQFGPSFAISAVARSDGHVNLDRDSTRVGTIDLPYTVGLGLRWRPSSKLSVAGQTLVRTWSGANSDLLALGGTGSQNTIEAAVGAEYTSDPKRPYRRPLRLGVRYATLPFPLLAGQHPREFGVSAGSGVRFAQQRAGVDLALEHVWRTEGPYSENGFILSLGVLVRP